MNEQPMGWPRARRVTARDRTRHALVDTALRLFSERGYVGVRVEDIAREAGVSRATFYKHFAERDEILAELFSRLLGDRDGDAPVPAGDDVEARVMALLGGAAERMAAEPVLARFVYSLPIRHDAVLPGGSAAPAVFSQVRDELVRGVAAGDLRDDIPVERILEVLGRIFEAGMRDWAEGRADAPGERIAELLGVVFHGLLPRPSRSRRS